VCNHAQAIVACDFCVVVTATFRLLYVFVVMEHTTRRILHVNVTAHPTVAWTIHQLREAIPADHNYRFLLHDRDSIFSRELDQHVQKPGLRALKTPPQSPQANALCERAAGYAAARMPRLYHSLDGKPCATTTRSMDTTL
jgi:putative transposase